MTELRPAPFRDLVTRLFRESAAQGSLFGLPRHKWYRPDPDGPDLSVNFHGMRAGNPAGPAAGPHTQLAQNILLSYIAGGRILEFKTVQERQEPAYPMPCIELAGRRVACDGAQPLFITDALKEYVAGAMLIEMFRQTEVLSGGAWQGLDGAAIFDLGVGYDLAGVARDRVRGFLESMCSAGAIIERLRAEIPKDFAAARGLYYPARISESVTLSVYPHCHAEEIEQIGVLLIEQHGFHLQLKLNPHILGRRTLDGLLCDALGYHQLRVNPRLYAAGMNFIETVDLCRRLQAMARRAGRGFSVKFCNLLEVVRIDPGRPAEYEPLALSGPPLYVLALTLANEVRRRVGPELATSFSGGVDRINFPQAVACGFVPVSSCTDLLLPGGYGRLGGYLEALDREMRESNAVSVEEFILKRFGQTTEARRLAEHGRSAKLQCRSATAWAAGLNTKRAAALARRDARYTAALHGLAAPPAPPSIPEFTSNAEPDLEPRETPALALIRSEVEDELPVCPNAAPFTFTLPKVCFDYQDLEVEPDGAVRNGPEHTYAVENERPTAVFADFCDECGVCEIRPLEGDPSPTMLECLPRFHRTLESWDQDAPRDGYVIHDQPEGGWIRARIGGQIYQLIYVRQTQQYVFDDGAVEALLTGWGHTVIRARPLRPLVGAHTLDMRVYHLLRYLREGVLDERQVNPINVQWMALRRAASGAPRA